MTAGQSTAGVRAAKRASTHTLPGLRELQRIGGSYGSSGIRFTTLPTVTCKDWRSEIPARDPGPEGPSEP